MKIHEIIKNRRLELGLTLEQIGDACGVNSSTVSRWESGEIENMRRDKIEKLAAALSMSPAVIMGWDAPVENGKNTPLTPQEQAVVSALRSIDPEMRQAFCSHILEYYAAFKKLNKLKKEIKGGD